MTKELLTSNLRLECGYAYVRRGDGLEYTATHIELVAEIERLAADRNEWRQRAWDLDGISNDCRRERYLTERREIELRAALEKMDYEACSSGDIYHKLLRIRAMIGEALARATDETTAVPTGNK